MRVSPDNSIDSDMPNLVDVNHYDQSTSTLAGSSYFQSAFHTPPRTSLKRQFLYEDKIPEILDVLPITEEKARQALERFYGGNSTNLKQNI